MPSDKRVITAWLDDADSDLAAARTLSASKNRHAAFHLQQAAEKLVKAVRLARGHYATASHRIDELLDDLPDEDEWRVRLEVLGPLSEYATAFRYPSASGNLKPAPPAQVVDDWAARIAVMLADARTAFLR